jgi:Ca2+-binding EF-hand superfamily protein
MKRFLGLLMLILLSAGIVLAQDPPPMPPAGGLVTGAGQTRQFQLPSFADMDKDKDKKISRDEFPSNFPAQMFDRLDANHDGFIDEEEWTAMRSRFGGGGGPRTGESLTRFLDADHDGRVSRDEFAKILSLFDALDKDHNGELSQDELNGFFRAVNEAQAQATGGVEVNNLFEKFDKNKDAKITAEEMGNEKTFKALDLNKDGFITREEADTALKQLKKASEAKKAQAPPPNN